MIRTKNKASYAPDILGKSQNWIQKVSSLRLSNIRVGYQLTSLIGDKEMKTKDDLFIPLFVKIIPYSNNTHPHYYPHHHHHRHQHGSYYVVLGGTSGIRIFQIIEANNNNNVNGNSGNSNSDVSIELLYEDLTISCVDCCLYDPTRSQLSFAILYSGQKSDETHFIRIIVLDNPSRVLLEQEYEGSPEKLAATNSFLLVAISPGFLRVFFGEKLHPVTEISSVQYTPVIFATAPRWIAIQVPQKDIETTTAKNAIVTHNAPPPQHFDNNEHISSSLSSSLSSSSSASSGDAARRVVSGLYTLSKMSWQVVQPFISQAYSSNQTQQQQQQQQYSNPKASSSSSYSSSSSQHTPHVQQEVGGGILVLDLESIQNDNYHYHDEDEKSLEKKNQDLNHSPAGTLPIITHFISHAGESLSVMSFSPTGLKLASADTHGQVIFVHALVPSGLTSHSHQVVGLLSTNRPYLLYKLVRGLTLAKIIDIGFDITETIAFASSYNGTVHVFDLNSTTTESNEIRSTPSSWGRSSSVTDSGTSPLNPLNLLGINGHTHTSNINYSNGNNGSVNGTLNQQNVPNYSDADIHVPLINVSQFLQLHRPDLRTLHGYSEMKIKLPLRESPLQELNQNHGNGGLKRDDLTSNEGDFERGRDRDRDRDREKLPSDSDSQSNSLFATNSTSFFHEVNMNSSTIFLPFINYFSKSADGTTPLMESSSGSGIGLGGSSPRKYEILIGTSEGILSRYLITMKTINGNQVHPNSLRELNRWDLCTPLTTATSTNTITATASTTIPTTSSHLLHQQEQQQQQQQLVSPNLSSPPPTTTSTATSTSWITAVGHQNDNIVDLPPVWMRPQCTLRVHRRANNGGKYSENRRYLSSSPASTSIPIPIESSAAALLRKKQISINSGNRENEILSAESMFSTSSNNGSSFSSPSPSTSSVYTSEIDPPFDQQLLLFFPERRPTNILKVDRHNLYVNSNMEIGEKIQSALVSNLPEISNSEYKSNIIVTKRIDDITAWEMDEDWETT